MKPLLIAAALVASSVPALAQWPVVPGGPRALLFADPDFRGEAIELLPGAEIPDLRNIRFSNGTKANDKVSSILIEGGARLAIFADPRCTGDRLDLTESVRDLRQLVRDPRQNWTWDDCITAARMPARAIPRTHSAGPRPWRHRPGHTHEAPRVVIFADPGFDGEGIEFEPGSAAADLRDLRFESGARVNDKVSSVLIEGGARLTLYADPAFSGDRIELTESVADLRKIGRTADGRWTWDDCVTALRVAASRGEEYRRRNPPPRH